MENIYDIRKQKQLQFIFSDQISAFAPPCQLLQSCAVVTNLYYTEKAAWYCNYLNLLPEDIALYIFSSNQETLALARKHCRHRNTFFLKKENRGRDLSAFLVAFRPYIEKYRLVCFLHDKKEHNLLGKKDADIWNWNLWGNMIGSENYVYNILRLFQENPGLGMLFPPEPLGEHKIAWYRTSWDRHFRDCTRLAREMSLSADISSSKPPITLGSVFWTRPEALTKLFGMNWRYEDFPEEPMPPDYTISHAVERIFGYVAQDAGYDVGTVMTERYASWSLLFLQDYVRKMFYELSRRTGVESFHHMRIFDAEDRIWDYVQRHKKFYLYGAGKFGTILLKLLREKNVEPAGFLVTDGKKTQEQAEGLNIYELTEAKEAAAEGAGIILTAYFPVQDEMLGELKKNGFEDYISLFENRVEQHKEN